MSTSTIRFDHSIIGGKDLAKQFLRELGVSRDWARVTLPEMQAMLKAYAQEKLFRAARAITEREGMTYDEADFVAEAADDLAEDEQPTAPVTQTIWPRAAAAPVAPPIPPKSTTAPADDISEVAGLLAKLLASSKQQLDVGRVEEIAKSVVGTQLGTLHDAMMIAVQALVDQGIKGMAPRELLIKTENTEVKIDGLQHFNFEKLLRTCSAKMVDGHRLNVWLYGPPGTGKTTAARNAAKALDLPFYCTGALLTKYDITGFIAAQGDLIRSSFREAWEHGGVFLFDEIDGSDPRAIVSFNSALANGVMAFPDKMVERHADCVMIAAANTTGMGATAEFSGRMKMDMASIDRFVMLDWPIDEKIETALSTNKEWSATVQRIRRAVVTKGIKGVAVTPRATIYGCALIDAGMEIEDVKSMVLKKAMSAEQWAMVA